MPRVLLAGDVHGNAHHMVYLIKTALTLDCESILQLGDMGYWEHSEAGVLFLDQVNTLCEDAHLPLIWLDGNHENHVMLRKTYFNDSHLTDEGFYQIRPNIFHSPRGNIFNIGNVKFCTFGGAWSIDRAFRTIGKSWWWEEEIDWSEVDAMKREHVDVLLTHDVPTFVDMNAATVRYCYNFHTIPEAEKNRKKLDKVAAKCTPDYIYHGHYHVDYEQLVDFPHGVVRVEGLSCDGSGPRSWTVLELK